MRCALGENPNFTMLITGDTILPWSGDLCLNDVGQFYYHFRYCNSCSNEVALVNGEINV